MDKQNKSGTAVLVEDLVTLNSYCAAHETSRGAYCRAQLSPSKHLSTGTLIIPEVNITSKIWWYVTP